ncbi:TPA: Sec-independent protein translocase TatA [Candidatus Geothermarchaeota archaeon]|nr:Sec-independent protein translocase TatA [Candidatus Geothermarchaeota archaeon]HIQ13744.1 Sec-independent protein translocase TatA [Thermoprotei archaeon]
MGFTEIMFLLIFFLILFGPDKLPGIARTLGKYYAELNRYRKALEEEFRKGLEEGGEALDFTGEAPKNIRPVRRVRRNVENGGNDSVNGDGE